jgi:hypothetical protein
MECRHRLGMMAGKGLTISGPIEPFPRARVTTLVNYPNISVQSIGLAVNPAQYLFDTQSSLPKKDLDSNSLSSGRRLGRPQSSIPRSFHW